MTAQQWLYCAECQTGSATPAFLTCSSCGRQSNELEVVDECQLRDRLNVGRNADARAKRIHKALSAPTGRGAYV